MSREPPRKGYFSRDPRNRDRDRDWNRRGSDYRGRPTSGSINRKSRSPLRNDIDKRRSRSPRKNDNKDLIDENILSEISKLPEPSELWDNQFQEGGYTAAPPAPAFPQEAVTNPNFATNYQPSYSGIYDDFPPVASVPTTAPLPPDMSTWNQMSLPPPPNPAPPPPFITNPEDQMKKEAAIQSEMRHQKAALSKQREDYIKKAAILKKELDTLKDQRNELRGDSKRSPSPDTKRFLKENTKLQLEIQNKLKTINNVVDMLNGIIGEEAQELHDTEGSPEPGSKRKSRSPSASQKFNYVYYDPEMHWCRVCNEFPPTAKDYLNHLHSPAHSKMAAAHMEAPWHSVNGINEGFPSFPSAPTKRTPIKGLQFFVPSTAWYCKLCDQFIGDLHCASAHLKSVTHSKNYTNFVEQNPHWETDWMSDRQKSFEKARASAKNKPEEKPPAQYTAHTITFSKDGFHTKKKDSPPPVEDKKKKKEKKKKTKKKISSSSSSSSNSSSSDSEPVKKKKKKKDKSRQDADDKTLSEWMSSIKTDRLYEGDRKLLDALKNRMKMDTKSSEEKRRSPETKSRRESVHRESRARDVRDRDRDRDRERDRDRREDSRRRDDDRRDDRRRDRSTTPRAEPKKPEIRKMPFIGKMPVYKHLGKTPKTEEQKKEDEKKKEEEEASKKRREEMDAEIQKKVAEFKEKIAKAQLDRQQATADIPPPSIALPTALGGSVPVPQIYVPPAAPQPPPPAPAPQPAPAPAPAPTLPKDFQDALDIIFPTDVKPDMSQQDLFGMPPGLGAGFPMGLGGVMPPFPPFLQPQMPPQMMMGFDINSSLFPPRPQLYDTHVPLVPSPKPRQNKNRQHNKNMQHNKHMQHKKNNHHHSNQNKTNEGNTTPQQNTTPSKETKENGDAAKKKEELDDLAMLGIDASDVGAGI
ncbi:zinc finger matrin-type protein CG9776-like isoform X2 [Pectinophora gossypiella]|uniref:zinc finger matrin-type protein CG9776-like isoform X2 n=1 Tax=Pectinophora gossypiella TaxID=13191 RepID=UPI00214F3AFE|nr:zinc finger matrin-type protein CG9776-like isoform X2 [Pectinophora gossypiella]